MARSDRAIDFDKIKVKLSKKSIFEAGDCALGIDIEMYEGIASFDRNFNRVLASIALLREKSSKPRFVNDYWYHLEKEKLLARVIVISQDTSPEYRGNGINGYLIEKANEIAKESFGTSLTSDTVFSKYSSKIDFLRGTPGKRVWEKLCEREKAIYSPYEHNDRWVMK